MRNTFNAKIVDGADFSSRYELPLIRRTDFKPLRAVPFNTAIRAKRHDRWVHFYLYDYIFECVWNKPQKYLPVFQRFDGVITPDYSLYRNMPLAMQIWNTYRNRALGYWLQANGINIVINVRWGDDRTYGFAFEGLPEGGTYAVCTHGCIQDKLDRYFFKNGLAAMVDALKPDTIVNYSYYSKDIFGEYENKGIEIITLSHWAGDGRG